MKNIKLFFFNVEQTVVVVLAVMVIIIMVVDTIGRLTTHQQVVTPGTTTPGMAGTMIIMVTISTIGVPPAVGGMKTIITVVVGG